MKNIMKKAVVLVLAFSFIIMQVVQVAASQATSFTYTLDERKRLVRTQDAYLPDRTITGLGLSGASDLVITEDDIMYIADSGNKRVVVYDPSKEEIIEEITLDGKLDSPRGLFIDEDGSLYIADKSAGPMINEKQTGVVFKLDASHKLVQEYQKPDAPIFEDSPFDPDKVAVDAGGNLYIVCGSNNNGIVQLAGTGEFLGYFTSNKTILTFKQMFLKLIYNKEQELKSEELNVAPPNFTSVCIDKGGVVYTVSMNGVASIARDDLLKKHNTSGGNMFVNGVVTNSQMTDVIVNDKGIIFTSDAGGYIDVYTTTGDLIFEFGAKNADVDISGLFSSLTTISLDSKQNIWAIDGEKGYLQSFVPTDYANKIYTALDLYEHGDYNGSRDQWNEVLKLNQMSVLAHNGLGKAYYHDGDYELAMEHFEIAGNRADYSEAFWEVRSTQISEILPTVAVVLVLLIVLRIAWFIGDRKKALSKKKRAIMKKLKKTPVIGELGYAFRTARHPIDRYYDIRVGKNGSLVAATIIYVVFFITYMIYQTQKGFIYQFTSIEDMDIGAVVIGFFAILILFIICNYLVTSINDGDGTFKQVYMIPAYGLIPAWISMIAVVICSYGLTYNESFLLTVMLTIGVGWSIANIFEGLATVHDYSFKDTVVSLIITFMFMIIAAVVVVIVIIMWDQLYDFLITLGKEIIRNVTA